MARIRRAFDQKLSLDRPGGISPAAWFLGPKGENEAAMAELVTEAVRSHVEARRLYKPGDPDFASEEELASKQHQDSLKLLKTRMDELLQCLSAS